MRALHATFAWQNLIQLVDEYGDKVSPRGQDTLELPQQTITVDMLYPVVTLKERKLSYPFMAAEAHWILSGDDRVATIAPYNKNISQFSDDGKTFFGAYGPKVRGQLDYVVKKLQLDPFSRQAGLTIWRENPPHTKDVPCTVAMFFSIRGYFLHTSVYMRSSDVWLGIPYDVFNFSMITYMINAILRETYPDLTPGRLAITAASSHLYLKNQVEAQTCARVLATSKDVPAPEDLWKYDGMLMDHLSVLRDSSIGDPSRWWA